MDETQAASSPAEDVFNGENPTLNEFNQYRESGEVPERFKPAVAASAPADTPKEEKTEGEDLEPSPDSDPEDKQEPQPKPSKRDKRIQQLLDETNELKRKLAEKEGVKTDSPPASAPQYANPKPTINDTNPDGTPKYAEYEDVVEAIGRWAAKEERATWEREFAEREAKKGFEAKMSEVRSRYEDADAVIPPTIKALNEAKLPGLVHEMFGTSPKFFDLCYEVGSDPEKMTEFIELARTDPRAAIKQVFAAEDKVDSRTRDDKGKFASKEAPETKKTTAPKPPSPVGGTGSRAFDVSDESLSEDEWMRQRNRQVEKQRG